MDVSEVEVVSVVGGSGAAVTQCCQVLCTHDDSLTLHSEVQ